MLKHLPIDALKTLQKTLLFSKKPVYFAKTSYDRRNYNSKDLTYTSLNTEQTAEKKKLHANDLNIDDRISLFQEQLKNEKIHRILIRYFSDIGNINFPTKIDYRIKIFLETNMNKWFKSREVVAANSAIPDADAEIIFTRVLFIQCEQILRDKNFRQHLETIMVSKKYVEWELKKHPYKKYVK